MKYCPKCHAEYHEQIVECSDCHKKLVRKSPVKESNEKDYPGESLRFKLNVVAFVLLCCGIVLSHMRYYLVGGIVMLGALLAIIAKLVFYCVQRFVEAKSRKINNKHPNDSHLREDRH